MLLLRSILMTVPMILAAATAITGQTVTEWDAETRVSLSLHVNEVALQKMLPPGWTSAPSTGAGNPGANLTVNFIDRQVVIDGQGKVYRTGTSRYIVVAAPARNAAGEMNTVVLLGLSPEGPGAYGVNLTAVVSRVDRSSSAEKEEGGKLEERWEFAAASGEKVELQLAFRRAAAVKTHTETKLRSARHPEFTRTYRVDQAADVLRSRSTPDRVDRLTFRTSGAAFAPLFDGQETLLSVTWFPWYVREISVP
jgi:hypothetical protein